MTSKWFRERREREGSKERLEADSRAVMVWIQSWSELSDFSHGLNSQISVIVWFLRLWILNQISDMIWILTQISVMLWIVTRSADFSQQFRFQSWYESWSETRSESHFGFLFNHRVLTRQLDKLHWLLLIFAPPSFSSRCHPRKVIHILPQTSWLVLLMVFIRLIFVVVKNHFKTALIHMS